MTHLQTPKMRNPRRLSGFHARLLALGLSGALTACGGGGAGAPAATTQFPSQLALSNLYLKGYTQATVVSGTANVSGAQVPVTGTATITQSPAKLTVYDGKTAYVVSTTTTGSAVVDGQTVPISSTTQSYFSLAFAPLGSAASGANCAAQSAGAYPVTVTAGQSGSVAAFTCSSGTADPAGSASITFVTAPGSSAASVLFTMTEQMVDPLGTPIGRIQVQYAMDTAGNMSVVYQLQLLVLGGIPMTLTFAAQSA